MPDTLSSGNSCFSYVRVSTQRQGQTGTSLTEQKRAIDRYAQKNNLKIVKYFEERETAAKQGRPVFLKMLKEVKKGKAKGLILHKIDRGARNLKDWVELRELKEKGVAVHFVNESIDLNSRGGMLSADIQAVVAADYIENLKQEAKKGIYGRLKQGLYPFPAVVGYLDSGAGKPKRIDPIKAPFVKRGFELYATGEWGLESLNDELYKLGLTNKKDNKISINGLSKLLKNPFYIGLIKIERTGELFAGIHEPIITKRLFEQVQEVFQGKTTKKVRKHSFLFRKQIHCRSCERLLIGEKQKGNVYYRCHTRNCETKGLREELIEKNLKNLLSQIALDDNEYEAFKELVTDEDRNLKGKKESREKALFLQLNQLKKRQSLIADAYVDEVFDKATYLAKKNDLILKEQEMREKLNNLDVNSRSVITELELLLELVNSAYLCWENGSLFEKREIVKNLTSNFSVKGKSVLVKLEFPFELIRKRPSFPTGRPQRDATRTFREIVKKLVRYFKNNPTSKSRSDVS